MKRLLSERIMNDLLKEEGKLYTLLQYVKSDNTLDIEIRENNINIYYRGGSALKVSEILGKDYVFHFDRNYLNTSDSHSAEIINTSLPSGDWMNFFPIAKQSMDFYFTKLCKEEREFQQLVVRENNYSTIANSTDYFILDIEYNNHKNARFDMVAIEWLSNASVRKLMNGYMPKLVIIEMKYGDGALKGCAGLNKHIDDFYEFIRNPADVSEFKNEMLGVFKQKRELGIIPCLSENGNKNIVSQLADDIEMMFMIANHDPASSILFSELECLKDQKFKFITSNFTGYCLFKENVFSSDQLIQRFQSQIYSAL
jgi:hypothetical protein